MIKLKENINKSEVSRKLIAKAKEQFEKSWQAEAKIRAYMNGVHDALKEVRK